MAVQTVELMQGSTAELGSSGEVRYQRTYLISCDSASDSEETALAGFISSVGGLGTQHPDNSNAYITRISIGDQEAGGKPCPVTYVATVDYEPATSQDPQTQESTPLDEPVQVNWTFEDYEEIVDIDAKDKEIKMTNGLPPDPGLTREASRAVLHIRKNVEFTGYNYQAAWKYANVVNSSSFLGAPKGHCLLKGITADLAYHTKIGRYWQIDVQVVFSDKPWQTKIYSRGKKELVDDGEGGTKLQWIVVNGERVDEPVNLDADGKKLEDGLEPHELTFNLYREQSFGFIESYLS